MTRSTGAGKPTARFCGWRSGQGRAVLTRRKDVLARQHPGLVLFVESDRVEDQIAEVVGKLGLRPEPDKLFTVCLRCNESLKVAAPDEVRPLVPEYVFRTQKAFRACPKCRRVFWPGSHRERAMKALARLLEGGDRG